MVFYGHLNMMSILLSWNHDGIQMEFRAWRIRKITLIGGFGTFFIFPYIGNVIIPID